MNMTVKKRCIYIYLTRKEWEIIMKDYGCIVDNESYIIISYQTPRHKMVEMKIKTQLSPRK